MTTEADIVAQAEAVVTRLEMKQKDLNQRVVELADERGRIAFSVHGEGDPKARVRLDKITAETLTLANEQKSVEEALVTAVARVNVARAGAAMAADREKAFAVRSKLVEFHELGTDLDDACNDIADCLGKMIAMLDEIHGLGQSFPTSEQFRINATMALKTMVQTLPQHWVNDFEFQRLAPNQKKTFRMLVDGWTATIERQIAEKLGETNEKAA